MGRERCRARPGQAGECRRAVSFALPRFLDAPIHVLVLRVETCVFICGLSFLIPLLLSLSPPSPVSPPLFLLLRLSPSPLLSLIHSFHVVVVVLHDYDHSRADLSPLAAYAAFEFLMRASRRGHAFLVLCRPIPLAPPSRSPPLPFPSLPIPK